MAARKLAHVSIFGVIALSVAIIAVIYLIPGIYTRPSHTPSIKAVSSVVVLGVVCTALAFFVFFILLERMGGRSNHIGSWYVTRKPTAIHATASTH